MKRARLHILVATLVLLCGCERASEITPNSECNISFGLEVAEPTTRVSISDTANSDGKFDVEFSPDDQIGIYLYYNNFFKYYSEYGSYAESVIFANQLIEVGDNSTSASYNPTKAWTFSTLYGTSPFKYDAIAYYPYTDSNIVNKWSESHIFTYTYDPTNIAKHCDFMIGTATYKEQEDGKFREEILAGAGNVALSFTREMAGMNICVSKADHLKATVIEITGMKLYFSSFGTYEYNQSKATGVWKDAVKGSVEVSAVHLDSSVTTLETTSEGATNDGTADGDTSVNPEDVYNTAVRLSADMLLKPLYFPPKTVISKIEISIKIDGVQQSKPYVWHPHVKEIVRNTLFLLNLELDPERNN